MMLWSDVQRYCEEAGMTPKQTYDKIFAQQNEFSVLADVRWYCRDCDDYHNAVIEDGVIRCENCHGGIAVLEGSQDSKDSQENIKRMDIKEFREEGFLQEANRLLFHPLGLALEVSIRGGKEMLSGVWDYRDDPEGMLFGDDTVASPQAHEKANRVEKLRLSKLQARIATEECREDGIQRLKAVNTSS